MGNTPFLQPRDLDPMVDAIVDRGYACADEWMLPSEALTIRSHLLDTYRTKVFKPAGVGKSHDHQVDSRVRGDHIHWIDESKTLPEVGAFFTKMRQLSEYLNRTCYLGIKDIEAHLTVYPPGTYYERHLDQFQYDDHRKLTFIYYLNPIWQPSDGGQLVIYQSDGTSKQFMPLLNRLVIFRSELLEHEVLPTQRERCSLTGWLLDQQMDLGFL